MGIEPTYQDYLDDKRPDVNVILDSISLFIGANDISEIPEIVKNYMSPNEDYVIIEVHCRDISKRRNDMELRT